MLSPHLFTVARCETALATLNHMLPHRRTACESLLLIKVEFQNNSEFAAVRKFKIVVINFLREQNTLIAYRNIMRKVFSNVYVVT
jgi:hypothetical protein